MQKLIQRGMDKHFVKGGHSFRRAYERMLDEYFNDGYELVDGVQVPIPRPADQVPTYDQVYYWYNKYRLDIEAINTPAYRADLERLNVRTWVDRSGLKPGTYNWEQALRDAIVGSRAVVFVASPNSRKSNYVLDEIEIARINQCAVIPAWIGGEHLIDAVPIGWGSTQAVDLRGPRYANGVQQLAAFINGGSPQGGTPKPEPRQVSQYDTVISYARHVSIESYLADELGRAFAQNGQRIYLDDQSPLLGMQGANYLSQIIEGCSHFVVLLSPSSTSNEVLREHLELVNRVQQQRPLRVLLVRVQYYDPFPYHLQPYLDPISWSVWHDDRDTPRVWEELRMAVYNGAELPIASVADKAQVLQMAMDVMSASVAMPAPTIEANPQTVAKPKLTAPRGTMNPESAFYVFRDADSQLEEEITLGGATVIVRAPRQMGKSSLLLQGQRMAARLEKDFIFVDLQQFSSIAFRDEAVFFRTFCSILARGLATDVLPIEEWWQTGQTSIHLTTSYMEKVILPAITNEELILALDEVDRLYAYHCPFRSDFFGMLRSWHNNRALIDSKAWADLTLLLSISTEPNLLIEDPHQSPFNVGEIIYLDDFSEAQMADLNRRYQNPFSPEDLRELYLLVNGHPYLTREAMYRVASNRISAHDMLTNFLNADHPFQDHLSHFLYILLEDNNLIRAMLNIIDQTERPSVQLISRLQGAGLVKMDPQNDPVPRCELYRLYFSRYLRNA